MDACAMTAPHLFAKHLCSADGWEVLVLSLVSPSCWTQLCDDCPSPIRRALVQCGWLRCVSRVAGVPFVLESAPMV